MIKKKMSNRIQRNHLLLRTGFKIYPPSRFWSDGNADNHFEKRGDFKFIRAIPAMLEETTSLEAMKTIV
jgi:hypothetical protein